LIDLSSYQIVQLTKQHLPSHQLTEQVKQVLADMAEQVLLSAGGG
jgi:hypothetical protein